MMKYFTPVLLAVGFAGIGISAFPAFAQDYSTTTTREQTDGMGDSVSVQHRVQADPYNASASRTVERNSTDAFGDTNHSVTTRSVDSNGDVSVRHYDRETSGE